MEDFTYLAGPTVCGFHGAFEGDFGCPATPRPLARITPSKIGSALLPFHCPKCESVIDFSDPKVREQYHDTRSTASGKQRDNYWCPSCGNRFLMNLNGKPFSGTLTDGVAPAEVETIAIGNDNMINYKRFTTTIIGRMLKTYVIGTDILGCC